MEETIFESKRISQAVLAFAIPAMLGQLSTLIYNIIDTYFVALTNDPNQIAAVTLCAPPMLVLMSCGVVFGAGGTSLIARLLGEKKNQNASQVFTFCTYCGFAASIVLMIAGLFTLHPVVGMLGTDTDNYGFTYEFLYIIVLGTPAIFLSNMYIHLFRATGHFKAATIGLVLATGVNVVLDYVFIVDMNLGVTGAAIATISGNIVNVLYYLFYILFSHSDLMVLRPGNALLNKQQIREIFSMGIPGALVTVLMSGANVVLNNYIGIYGSGAVAAYGVSSKINLIPIMLIVGLTQGVAPLLGYCYGAKNILRLRKIMKFTIWLSVMIGLIFTAIFFIARESIAGLFLRQHDLLLLTTEFLCLMAVSNPIFGLSSLVTAFYQALGKPGPSLLITLLRNMIIYLPVLILFNHFLGVDGVIFSQPLVDILIGLFALLLYQKDIKVLSYESEKWSRLTRIS